MRWIVISLGVLSPLAVSAEEILARCGESEGRGWYFYDDFWNPDGSGWLDDGIAGGSIILVRYGDGWDIRFDDIAGGYSYRRDGATVMLLSEQNGKLMIGAFHPNYADIYTFDLANAEVAWTSQKTGPLVPKVAVYHARCGL